MAGSLGLGGSATIRENASIALRYAASRSSAAPSCFATVGAAVSGGSVDGGFTGGRVVGRFEVTDALGPADAFPSAEGDWPHAAQTRSSDAAKWMSRARLSMP